MSQAGEREEGETTSVDDLTELVGTLRAELQSIRERELRREGRLVTFDQQVAQMEASLEAEVERLRTTGSAVDLITEHLQIAVRELLAERKELSDALGELGERMQEVRPPDLEPVLTQLDLLNTRIAGLPVPGDDSAVRADVQRLRSDLLAFQDALGAHFEALDPPDLHPISERLRQLSEELASAPTVDALRAELGDLIVERLEAAAAPPIDLEPLGAQLERLQTAVAEGLRTLPRHDDTAVRADLELLHQQVDGVRASLTDRLDTLAAPDLTSLHEALRHLDERIAGLPQANQVAGALAPQLEAVRVAAQPDAVIGAVEATSTALAGQIGALPDQISEALRDANASEAVIDAVEAAATRLAGQIGGLPDQVSVVSEVLSPLNARIERLLQSDTDVRGDLALVTEVLAGLTQLAETGDQQLSGLVSAQQTVLSEQRTLVAESGRELTRSVTSEVQQLGSQLADVVARTSSLDGLLQELAGTKEALAGLTAKADRAEESGRETADTQALSLARVTAAADGLATALGSLRTSIDAAITNASQATVAGVDERLAAHMAGATDRLEAGVATELREHLGELGVSQLRVSVAELTQQVVEGRTDDRALRELADEISQQMTDARTDDRKLREAIGGVKGQVGQLNADGITPLRSAVDELRARIDALPAPDLGPVASQLARLSATIVSQARQEAATPGQVDAVAQSLEAAIRQVADRLEAQTKATAALQAQLAEQTTTADPSEERANDRAALRADVRDEVGQATAGLREEMGQVTAGLHESLARISAEVTSAREAAERRSGSRWRRGGGEDESAAREPGSPGPSELELRIEQALATIDHRMGSLAEVAERAAAYADDAAKAASAALRVATAPPAPLPPPPPAPPPSAPAAKTPAAKKTPDQEGRRQEGADGSEGTRRQRGRREEDARQEDRRQEAPGADQPLLGLGRVAGHAPQQQPVPDGRDGGEDEPLDRVRQMRTQVGFGWTEGHEGGGVPGGGLLSRVARHQLHVGGEHVVVQLRPEAIEIDSRQDLEGALGGVGGPDATSALAREHQPLHGHRSGGGRWRHDGAVAVEADEPPVHDDRAAVVEAQRREDPATGRAVEGAVLHHHGVVVLVPAGRRDVAVEDRVHGPIIDAGVGGDDRQHLGGRHGLPRLDQRLVVPLLVQPSQLPEREQHHRDDERGDGHVSDDPLGSQGEAPAHAGDPIGGQCGRPTQAVGSS